MIVDAAKRRSHVGMWRDERGQSFILVALMLTMLLGFIGIVAPHCASADHAIDGTQCFLGLLRQTGSTTTACVR